MKRLTTSEVAARLDVAQVTVNVWCLQGKFPNAVKEETGRGALWTIPESDLDGFVKPTPGRPPKSAPASEKRATGRASTNNGRSPKKVRGKK